MSYETQAAVKDKNYAKAHEGPSILAPKRAAPTGKVIEIEGEKVIVFDLDEYKELAHIITDYHFLYDISSSLQIENHSLRAELGIWDLRCKLWESVALEQKSRADSLSAAFDKERSLRLLTEKKKRMLGWIPWALVAIESVAIGAIGIYSGVR